MGNRLTFNRHPNKNKPNNNEAHSRPSSAAPSSPGYRDSAPSNRTPPAAAAGGNRTPQRPYSSPPDDYYMQQINELTDFQDHLSTIDTDLSRSSPQLDREGLVTALSMKLEDLEELRQRTEERTSRGNRTDEQAELLLQTLVMTLDQCRTTISRLQTAPQQRTVTPPESTVTSQSSDVTPHPISPAPTGPLVAPASPSPAPAQVVSPARNSVKDCSFDAGNRAEDCTLEDWRAEFDFAMKGHDHQDNRTTIPIDRKEPQYIEVVFSKYERLRDRELKRRLNIVYEDEEGKDGGALTRDFFQITFDAIISRTFKDCAMMEGTRGHLLPTPEDHLVGGFKSVGVLLAHAARNECRGLPGLSPAIQHYIIYADGPAFLEEMAPPMTIDDITNDSLRNLLIKLHSGENLTEADKEVMLTWMDRSGCHTVYRKETVDLLIQTMLVHFIFKMRIRQIEAIAQGLDTLGLRKFLRENPSEENIRFVFPSPDEILVTAEMFIGRIQTRGQEINEQALDFLKQFIHELDRGSVVNFKVSDVIQFLSGAPYLPTVIVIAFSVDHVYPSAHCCFNELVLPVRHASYDAFRDAMVFSLEHGTGFSDQ